MKTKISDQSTLGYYNPKDKTRVIADASSFGFGAVLLQFKNNVPRVITYASKSLTDTERRYCQTEKEALALVWAVERFNIYLYGKHFQLVTDHKPLQAIFTPTSKPCARIERWVLRLQSYDFEVIYCEGKNNIADPLSRLYVEHESPKSFDKDMENYIFSLAEMHKPKALKLDEIEQESEKENLNCLFFCKLPDNLKNYVL